MAIKIQWIAHSAFILEFGGKTVLIDPFISGNPLATIQPGDVSPDVILLSHAHGDHLGDTVDIAKASGAPVITNFEVSNYLSSSGVEEAIGGNPGGTVSMDFMSVKLTRAYHSSSFPDGSYGGVPCGFIISADDKRLYFAGDTALFSDMQLIGDHGIDLAILPIGDLFTMGVEDSIKAINYVRPSVVLPMHYNTFPPITQNAGDWAELVNTQTDATPVVLDPGSEYTLE